jgi:hypothetical protein
MTMDAAHGLLIRANEPRTNARRESVREPGAPIMDEAACRAITSGRPEPPKAKKKADEVEGLVAFHLVGLLVNEPPGTAGLPFI